ncbi:MAG: orotidine-5'-phosphate decarboxylase [Rickettsiales bacterium]|nr:orotidine-5'-phosphate decarboxylase [Rickettsiales bacterium]
MEPQKHLSDFISTKPILREERLIFALDVEDFTRARQLVEQLGEQVRFYKVGLELFMLPGCFDFLRWLREEKGKKLFLDLKFFDVPRTVGAAVRQVRALGATFTTVHGNDSILEAAVAEAGSTGILAVTALTSLDKADMASLGFHCDIGELVLSRAKRAFEIGCSGVVSSGLEVTRLRENANNQLVVVTPGIRPASQQGSDDQKRVVDVPTAFRNGSDYIVVGRPIRDAANPAAKAAEIQQQIAQLFS